MRHALDSLPAERGVGGNHAIHGVALQGGGNHFNLRFVQVRRNLHKNRYGFTVRLLELLATFGNGAQQAVQRFIALQGTQILGVRTGDVDGDVVGLRVDAVQASQVIIHRVFDRRDSVFADVQAQQQRQLATGLLAKSGCPHMAQKGVQPFIVKA